MKHLLGTKFFKHQVKKSVTAFLTPTTIYFLSLLIHLILVTFGCSHYSNCSKDKGICSMIKVKWLMRKMCVWLTLGARHIFKKPSLPTTINAIMPFLLVFSCLVFVHCGNSREREKWIISKSNSNKWIVWQCLWGREREEKNVLMFV